MKNLGSLKLNTSRPDILAGIIIAVVLMGPVAGCKKMAYPSGETSEVSTTINQRKYSDWGIPVNLGSAINTLANEQHPFLSKDGLSLFFTSDRQGTLGGLDLWVSERESLESAWGPPQNLGLNINSNMLDMAPSLSPDEHWLYFHSSRSGGSGDADLYVARRRDRRDNFGWEPATNLGPVINGVCEDAGPTFYENEATGETILYFNTRRPVSGTGPCGELHIWQSIRQPDGSWGPATYVPELSSTARDTRTAIRRRDGLEIVLSTGRTGGQGGQDLWASTRPTTLQPWGVPVNLGPTINTSFFDGAPALSFDAKTLIFFSNRTGAGSYGGNDLYMSTRTQLHGPY